MPSYMGPYGLINIPDSPLSIKPDPLGLVPAEFDAGLLKRTNEPINPIPQKTIQPVQQTQQTHTVNGPYGPITVAGPPPTAEEQQAAADMSRQVTANRGNLIERPQVTPTPGGVQTVNGPYGPIYLTEQGAQSFLPSQPVQTGDRTANAPMEQPVTSIPYPTAIPQTAPSSGGIDFNQMALSLANPQAAQSRNISFSGPDMGILQSLLAKEASGNPQERSSMQKLNDPLGFFPNSGKQSTAEKILDPGNIKGLFGF